MNATTIITRTLEVCGGLFMLAVAVITVIFFTPKFLYDQFAKLKEKNGIGVVLFFIFLIASILFLNIIAPQI